MKTTKLLLIFMLFFAPFANINAQNYTKNWAKVDSLTKLNLPKSALAEIDIIYKKAKKDNNSQQIIKSFIHRLKFKNQTEDNAFEQLCWELDSTAKIANFPENAIMHSMLGEMYFWYYENNRYKFYNRTNTVGFKNDDMQTWSLDKLVSKMIFHYNSSLKAPSKLQKLPISDFSILIVKGSKDTKLRPTLYDFLAHRAIDFYANQQLTVTQPADYFELSEKFYFASAAKFSQAKISSKDTLSVHYHAMQIMQELVKFRASRKNEIDAFIDIELKRLKIAHTFSIRADKDDLYLAALKRGEQKFASHAASANISYQIAQEYMRTAGKYQLEKVESYKYKNNSKKAHEICKTILKKFPKTYAAQQANSLILSIEHHNLIFSIEKVIPQKTKFSSLITFQNIDEIFVKVVEIDRSTYDKLARKYSYKELYDKLLNSSKAKYEFSEQLPKTNDYNFHTTEILLNPLAHGFYIVFMSNNKAFTYQKGLASYTTLRVSNISYMHQSLSDGRQQLFVTDRVTGKPLAGVTCKAWTRKYSYVKNRVVRKKYEKYTTDKNGMVIIAPSEKDYATIYIDFYNGSDFLSTDNSLYLYRKTKNNYDQERTVFFTDRGIYRPGQTIYFKGICLLTKEDKTTIQKNKKETVTLYDTNSQKVSSLDLTSNEYGSYSGSFDIPLGLMNGQFNITSGRGQKYIQVEEYKRLVFETQLEPFAGHYKLGEKVSVYGKATSFAGSVISDADVKYTVTRTPRWGGWYYRYFTAPAVVIKNGTAKTDNSGKYKIEFEAQPDLSIKESEFVYFSYSIKVDVTDISGETQSTSSSLNVGYRALKVSLPLSGDINSNNKKFNNEKLKMYPIGTYNLNGEFIEAKGTIKISRLAAPKSVLKARLWQKPEFYKYSKKQWERKFPGNVYKDENNPKKMEKSKLITTLNFDTKLNKKADFSFLKKYKPGYYVAEISSEDAFGKTVSNKHFFQIFSDIKTKMPYKSPAFFKGLKVICEPGVNAEFLIGTSYKNVKVVYQIEHQGEIIKTVILELSNELRKITIPVKEKYRGNFSVHFAFVKNNRIYNSTSTVYVPHTNKKLDIKFSTFRDKLLPGQKEEWNITIKGHKGEKLAAEMLATLYDASLDKFKENYWNFNVLKSYYPSASWSSTTFAQKSSTLLKIDLDNVPYIAAQYYNSFNWFGFSYYNYSNYLYVDDDFSKGTNNRYRDKSRGGFYKKKDRRKESKAAEVLVNDMEEEAEPLVQHLDAGILTPKVTSLEINAPANPVAGEQEVKVRTNFSETAFFYPHLKTNKAGEIIVSFTVPEALTKWKMMGFAHTQDLKSGMITNELVTQKDLMLMPNVPRFFRENDKITFPVKVANISENDMNGSIKLEFFDAISMQPISNIFAKGESASKVFSTKASGNSVVKWNLEIPEGVGAITYKVVAKSSKFSDGEQKPLPVLSNRMLVTESFPLPIRGNESKVFKFNKLLNSGSSKSLRNHKVTLEFTSNPAWYAVQALPYLIEYPYECSEQTFSRFYANSIAAHAANSSPKIKRVFQAWKNTPNSGALISNLEKNQELKAVMLEETPWVLDGKNESQRKKRLGLLFDLNKMANEQARALKKLQKAQKYNGGWPWFEGMKESRYITQYIANGLGHLDAMGVKSIRQDAKTWKMLKKAIAFLDGKIVDDLKYLEKNYTKKGLKENHLSQAAIQYMY